MKKSEVERLQNDEVMGLIGDLRQICIRARESAWLNHEPDEWIDESEKIIKKKLFTYYDK